MLKKKKKKAQKNKSGLLYSLKKSDQRGLYMYSRRSQHSQQKDEPFLSFFPQI